MQNTKQMHRMIISYFKQKITKLYSWTFFSQKIGEWCNPKSTWNGKVDRWIRWEVWISKDYKFVDSDWRMVIKYSASIISFSFFLFLFFSLSLSLFFSFSFSFFLSFSLSFLLTFISYNIFYHITSHYHINTYHINHPPTQTAVVSAESGSVLSAVDLYFMKSDLSTFKISFVYHPYFYILAKVWKDMNN